MRALFRIPALALLLAGCVQHGSTTGAARSPASEATMPAPGTSASGRAARQDSTDTGSVTAVAKLAPELPDGFSPLPDIATGGQPREEDFAALARAGVRTVIDLRTPLEPRGFDEPAAARASGLRYESLPIVPGLVTDDQFSAFRGLLADSTRRPAMVHCAVGGRVATLMIPYLILDRGLTPERAVELAGHIGPQSDRLQQAALEYARRQSAAEGR